MTKILIAEDDANIRRGLVDTLESEGYEAVAASNGKEALTLFAAGGIDLLLLDIMMPEQSGYDVCREVRRSDRAVPIVMLTAKGEEIDKVLGLELGADDYVCKPFGVRELLARIAAVLRRARPTTPAESPRAPDVFAFGACEVDRKTLQIQRDGKTAPLTLRELHLLETFCRHPGEALSRDMLLNEVWGIDYLGTTRTLDQHIANLRKKVEVEPASPTVITTVHGVGYRFQPSHPS
jgi:DNA-binding response OmpR family regulator